ncbi:MAG TPA: hypothetical protein VJ852_08875 [Gemmatimonadaceae bacterium]|nr:hypothetical protein [Gemmatimonadaceae bacterium]
MKPGILFGAGALLLGMVTAPSEAQTARRGPPIIQIYSDNGVDYVGTSSYITPRIEVAENAYVFAVEMDMDGEIQVLHPDYPGLSVRIAANRSLQLPNFFAGFNSSRYGGGYASYDRGYYGVEDSRGTVIALASRVPFNLEKLESAGDWDVVAIRRLMENRPPLSAAASLAAYIGQPGEPIGRDYLRFEGGSRYGYPYYANAYNSYYSPCAFYGYRFAFLQVQALSLYSQLQAAGRGVRLAGYDICGTPIFVSGYANGGQGTPVGHFPPPRGRGDTTVFPKSRLPHSPIPRGSTVFSNTDDAMPIQRGGGVPQTIEAPEVRTKAIAPRSRRYEPYPQLEPLPGAVTLPQSRQPVERATVPRGEANGASARPVPQYRQEPRVESAPMRAPDRPREYSPPPVIRERPYSPPPVIHERPSSPAPAPPPRAEPTTRSEPPRTPPPSRGN